MSLSSARARPSITMVSDLPEPWVCQITPPLRRAIEIELLDALDRLADAEELLVARDLA